MEAKKSLRANLEKGKSISFMMGAIVALSVIFTGFEWGEKEINVVESYGKNINTEPPEEVVITYPEPEPPEPPKPEIIVSPVVIVVVDDSVNVEPLTIAPTEGGPDLYQPVFRPAVVEEKEEPIIEDIFSLDVMPEFPGGNSSLLKWIAENVKYPTVAIENGIDGLVSCSFVVNVDGTITDVKILRSRDALLDKEAVRVIKQMPNWKPGVMQGRNMRVRYSVPVRFKLQK